MDEVEDSADQEDYVKEFSSLTSQTISINAVEDSSNQRFVKF